MPSRQFIYPAIPQSIDLFARGVFIFFRTRHHPEDLELCFEDIDVVIHLAATADATASINNLPKVERVNYLGKDPVATECTNTALLISATSNVYASTNSSVHQDCTKLNPRNPYANSKIQAEQLLTDIGAKTDLNLQHCNLALLFSPSIGLRFHAAVDKFCWQVLKRSSAQFILSNQFCHPKNHTTQPAANIHLVRQ